MKMSKLVVTMVLTLATVLGAYAAIGVGQQAQLGNPTNATVDASNHSHYLLERAEYSLDYSDSEGEANWVSWDLTTADIGSAGRSNNFIPDPDLPSTFYALVTGDYTGSGYDRGHMSPSADRTITADANQHTFILSNILPQAPDNNQGVWANFEGYCRTLASAGNELLITSGGSIFNGSRILSGKAAIPGYTWKIVVVVPLGAGSPISRITPATRIIAIKIPNIAGVRSTPWQNFVTSVAQIETDTGFTFLTSLPSSTANALRSVVDGETLAGSPAITSQPSAQTTVVGGSATFSVTATGDAPLTYQWFHGDDDIDGATGATLTLNNVQAADLGNYYVTVTNSVASTTSNTAALVILGLPPTVTTPPSSQTVNAGANLTFSVVASGSPTLTYQWRKDGAPLSGATATSFAIANAQAENAGNYDVVVTNSVNSVTSAAASLVVNPAAPTISGQPASRSADSASNASFTVVASGTAPLTYQWRKEGVPLTDGGVYSGTATATLLLTGLSAANGGNYDVVVTNSLSFATSAIATLQINPPPPGSVTWNFGTALPGTADPVISATADVTSSAFSQHNNNGTTAMLTNASVSSGYTGASGAVNAGAATFNGPLNKTTSTYFEFTVTPSAGKRLFATGLSFGSRSTGTGPTAYDIFSSADGFTAPVASGTVTATSAWRLQTTTFQITGATDTPVTFRIYGSNGAGATGSTAVWRLDDVSLAVSSIFPPPVTPAVTSFTPATGATSVPIATPITVTFNEAVNVSGAWFALSSAANGPIGASFTGGPTTYTIAPASNFANTDTITVTIFGAQVVDRASGSLQGAANTTFSFTTEAFVPPTPPTVTTQPVSQTLSAGANATLTVAASGSAPLFYQWRKSGTPISGNSTATTASLVLNAVTPADSGSYDCVVTNVAGNDISHVATLTVNLVGPSITAPPSAQTAKVGAAVTFTITAAGTPPFTYQWRKDGVPLVDGGHISGALTATLSVSGLSANDAGNYDVVVGNGAGSLPSATAALIVTDGDPATANWDFSTADPTGLPAGVTGGTVTQGNNNGTTPLLTTTSASSGYTGSSGGNNAGAAARVGPLNQGVNGSAYFEFTLTPPTGRQVAIGGISFGARSTGTGPQAIAIYSSVDNFAVALATFPAGGDTNWHLYTPSFRGVTSAVSSPVTIRIYGYGGAGSAASNTANWRIDDLKVSGGLLALPPTAPVVSSTSPTNGATNVAVGAPVTVTFNEPVNVSDSWYTFAGATSGPVVAVVSGGPSTFTLTPSANLAPGDTFTVTLLGSHIVDQATGTLALASNYAFSFTTALPPPPMISGSTSSQTVTVGDTVNFSVTASGAGPLSYQWRKDTVAITGNAFATTATLTLSNVRITAAGSYDCVVTNQGGFATSSAATLTVNPAPATITLGSLNTIYNGAAKAATATTNPAGLSVNFTYNGGTTNPVNVGSYAVVATISDPNYTGSTNGTLVIAPANIAVSLGDLTQIYDGSPKPVTANVGSSTATPVVTYNGSSVVPIYPGSYAVVATVAGGNYSGSAAGTLVIETLALVRHAPVLNGGIDGSVQVLLPEATTFNSNGWISGDLLVPGTPTVRLNGRPTFAGTIDAAGSAAPSDYTITLNSGAVLRHLVRRIDAATMPTVATPPAPTGTRNVALNNSSQSPGDFATLRNLTLNSNVGQIVVPPGTYGTLTANSNTGFTLGVAGGTEPVVYNLQGLTLNSSSRVTIVGPVILNVASSVALNGPSVGNTDHPEWLRFNVASGGLTLNSNVSFYGFVIAPNGTVTINSGSTISGGVMADRLTLNSNGVLDTVEP